MDYNALTQFIGTVGFPIVACGALFISQYKERKDNRSIRSQEATTRSKQTELLSTVVQSNTKAMETAMENNTAALNAVAAAINNLASRED